MYTQLPRALFRNHRGMKAQYNYPVKVPFLPGETGGTNGGTVGKAVVQHDHTFSVQLAAAGNDQA